MDLSLSLVSMPWSARSRPSGALAALSAFARAQVPEVSTVARYEYVEASEALGEALYEAIAADCYRIGEVLYGTLLYPERTDAGREAFVAWARETALDVGAPSHEQCFDGLRAALAEHVERAAKIADESDVVGFTCAFGQIFGSVLVARRMKERNPRCEILFGGSSVSRMVGPSLLREYPCIDWVIQGEGELPLAAFLRARLAGEPVARPEILGRGATSPAPKLAEVPRLDDLPLPDYDEYAELAERYAIEWALPIEGSRGCWWDRSTRSGDPTKTCYFCNVNVQWNGYREKTIERVVDEIGTLGSRHKVSKAFFVDNIIRHQGAQQLGEAISALGRDLDLFYEARSNLRPIELLAMWEAGLGTTQYGIEALSSSVLKRIGKGTLALQNLEAMRLLTELEIDHMGNLIVSFPGSTQEEVAETVRTIESAAIPFQPLSTVPFYLTRGSTVDVLKERFGVVNVRNREWFRAGLPDEVWRRLELFDLDYDTEAPQVDWSPVREAVAAWRARNTDRRQKLLVYRDCVDFLSLEDRRHGDFRSGTFDGLAREVYLACLETKRFAALVARFPEASEEEIREVVSMFVEFQMMFQEGDRVLSLAVATAPRIAARRIRAEASRAERERAAAATPPARRGQRSLSVVG